MTPELSIVVVLYNSADELPACARSVAADVGSGWAELIAVDNASPDQSVAVLQRELPAATHVALDGNRGFAGGVNAALPHVQGRYVLLLNPDVVVPEQGLRQLVAWMDAHPQVAVASPNIVAGDGHWESPGRAFPSILRTLLEMTRLHRLLPARIRGRLLLGPYWSGGDQFHAGWVPGTAMIVREPAIKLAGRLREDLFMYGEDIEWCWRLRRSAGAVGVCASTTFMHTGSASAVRSWGDEEKGRRIAAGIDKACRIMYGTRHARVLAVVTALAHAVESRSPNRQPADRLRNWDAAKGWLELARAR